MSKEANEPVYPIMGSIGHEDHGGKVVYMNHDGLTKREYIATHVLPECIEMFSPMDPVGAAKAAVQYADALLAELEK